MLLFLFVDVLGRIAGRVYRFALLLFPGRVVVGRLLLFVGRVVVGRVVL